VTSSNEHQLLQPLWAAPCPLCDEVTTCPFGCGLHPTTLRCVDCTRSEALIAAHRTCVPTALTLEMCDVTNLDGSSCMLAPALGSMCQKGYYHYSADNTCLPCLQLSAEYVSGAYPTPCPRTLLGTDLYTPCTFPPLPNQSVFAYGTGYAYADCAATTTMVDASALETCAYFQTPKWGQGYCSVVCQPGFATLRAPASPTSLPQCAPCATACAPGYAPPHCPGGPAGLVVAQSPACAPCDPNLLPLNANWSLGCAWTCNSLGFYAPARGASLLACVACTALTACPTGQRWLGCGASSPGACAPCVASSSCIANNNNGSYLRGEVFMRACECTRCTSPSTVSVGQFFVLRNCSGVADLMVQVCSTCIPGVTYAPRACRLYHDTECAPCNNNNSRSSLLLRLSACNATADARYGPCPRGLACNGSATAFVCPSTRVPDNNGSCVCPPATVELGEACVPIACDVTLFADPATGGCSPCIASVNPQAARGRAGRLGFEDGCGCADGFFAQHHRQQQTLECWPCGDLGCVRGVQQQTPSCIGSSATTEPTCACGPGPGMVVVDNRTCEMRCAQGFVMAQPSAPSLTPGLADRFTFARLPAAAAAAADVVFSLDVCDNKNELAVVPFGPAAAAALVLCGSSDSTTTTLWIVVGALAQQQRFDTTVMEFEGKRAQVRIRALIPHRGGADAGVWLLYNYYGLCDPNIDALESRWCSAFDLLYPSFTNNNNNNNAGSLLASTLWGNNFQNNGIAGLLTAAAWGPIEGAEEGALYFIVMGALGQYNITFYDGATPYDQRADDTPRLLGVITTTACAAAAAVGVKAMAYAMDGLYFSAQSPEPVLWRVVADYHYHLCYCELISVVRSARRLEVLPRPGGRLLLQQQDDDEAEWTMLDLWNRIQSPPTAAAPVRLWWRRLHDYYYRGAVVEACPVDTFAVLSSSSSCQPMQCVRPAPCGPLSMRAVGAETCGCEPGYYRDDNGCAACPSRAYFCPGGSAPPSPCPDNAVTAAAATRASDCRCGAGYLEFEGVCLRCPTSLLCPFNGTRAPLPCFGGGYTLTDGTISPLACLCPPRTHGIRCRPCDAGMDCSAPATPVRAYTALLVEGPSGASLVLAAPAMLDACLSQQQPPEDYYWFQSGLITTTWLVVLPGGAAAAIAGLRACLEPKWVTLTVVGVLDDGVPMLNLMAARSCGGEHWYWDPSLQACGCVPGYYAFFDAQQPRCIPCPNGTARAEGADTCAPCAFPGEEEAPWLGMAACRCIDGYAPRLSGGGCSRGPTAAAEGLPLQQPLLFASVALGTGALCFSLLVLVLF